MSPASISLPKCEPPQAMILRRRLYFFRPMKKENFSNVYICPFRHAGN